MAKAEKITSRKTLPQRKKRGVLLSILLIVQPFGILLGIYALFNMHSPSLTLAYKEVPDWYLWYAVAGTVLSVINFIGLLKWKKWIVYSLALSFFMGFGIQFMLQPNFLSMRYISIAALIFSAAFWGIAIYRKWSYFE